MAQNHEDAPSTLADFCHHAGIGKACWSCRALMRAAARDALTNLALWHEGEADNGTRYSEDWYEHRRASQHSLNFQDANYAEDFQL